jgi:hypothetical protein
MVMIDLQGASWMSCMEALPLMATCCFAMAGM